MRNLKKNTIFAPIFTHKTVMQTLEDIRRPVEKEFAQYEEAIAAAVASDNALVQAVMDHVFQKRGKQMRPFLVLLSAAICGQVNSKTIGTAVALELLHTASLVHDDVVDMSPTRRGQTAAHVKWDNKVAILTGDYILGKVIELMAGLRSIPLTAIIARLGQRLSTGEILQLHVGQSMWISEEQYMRVIEGKTAELFAACTEGGAVSVGASEKKQHAMERFGRELGLVFQLQDDVLDYGDSEELGKPTMQDIRDGKATLPLLKALERAPKSEADEIRSLCEQLANSNEDENEVEQRIKNFVLRYDGIGYAGQVMQEHKKKAMEALQVFHGNDACKQSLTYILNFAINRVK